MRDRTTDIRQRGSSAETSIFPRGCQVDSSREVQRPVDSARRALPTCLRLSATARDSVAYTILYQIARMRDTPFHPFRRGAQLVGFGRARQVSAVPLSAERDKKTKGKRTSGARFWKRETGSRATRCFRPAPLLSSSLRIRSTELNARRFQGGAASSLCFQ